MIWDPIIAIEAVGTALVYDIEVEGTHNFLANGLLAHNSNLTPPPSSADPAGLSGLHDPGASGNQVPPISQFLSEEARTLLAPAYEEFSASLAAHQEFTEHPLPPLTFSSLTEGEAVSLGPDPERPASFIMDLAQVGRDGERLRQLWWEAVWQWARRQSLRAQEQFLSRNPMLVDEERFEMVMQSKRTFFHRVGIRPKDTVLDLGVGWAENAIPLAELGARVVGIDHSKRMLEFARDNLEQAGVLDRVQLLQGDVLWPPVGAEAFDDVLLQQVALHLLPRFRPRLIQGMARALKPGGAAIILETVRPDGADRGTGDLWTAADWREHLAAAGLSEIRAIPSGDATFMILVARRPQTPPTSAANQSNQEQAQSAQPQQGESSAPAPRPSDMSRREFLKAVSGAVAAACVGAGCATVPEDRAGVPPARHPQTFAESVEAFFNDPRVVSAWHVPAKELFDPVEIFSRRSPHETRLLPLHVLAKEFVTWNTLHPLARVSRIKGEYEQETGERLSEALLLKLVEFEQLTGASSSDRRRVLEAYKALQDALGKSRRAQGFLRVDLEFGMDVGFRSHLRWQVRELVNPAIRKTLPPALAEALDVAHQFLSQTKPWNPSVTGALDTIAQLLAQPSLRREVLRTYEQFVGSERERFVDLASAWLSPQQVKETERWLTTHDVRVFQVGWLKDMPRDHPLLLTYLAAVRAACESAGIPPVRYRGVELLVESSQISYVPGDDLLTLRFETLISNMALSGRLVSGLTGDPSQGLWHLLRKTIVHEISHRWDYRQLPPDVRGAFHRVSWLGPYSLRPDAHLATDFVFGDDEIAKTRDDVERVEDLAEIIEALTDSLPARFEVSRAIDHLLTGRPHLANKIAFAYSFWGRIPDPALPWIVRTDGALPDQLHGAYVFQDARGKRFEVRLRPDGRIERLREVIEPFDPNVFVWQTPEPPNRLKSSGNNFENNPVTAAVLARLVTGKAPDAGSTGSLEREAAQSAVPPEGVVVNAEQPNERHLTREEALRGIDAGRLATVRLPNGSVRWLFTIAGGSGRNDDQEEAQPTEEDTSPLRKKVQEALKRVDGRISVEQMAAAMGERRAALAGLRFHLIVVEENSRRKREEPSRRLLSQRSYNPATTILHALKLMDGEVMERQVAELTGLAAAVVRRRGKWPYVLSVENLRRRREEPARHLLRAYMTKEEVLAVLERCGWKMEQARRETGFGSFGEWYEFLERKGAMPELRARLIEQLNLRDWVIRRVARNFEETALVIDGLMGRLGIKRSEVSKESILEILERHDWNLGEAASELHLGDNERLEDFFNRHALFSEFWLKLRERLEAERWVMRTVARRFGVGEKRIKDLSKRLDLPKPEELGRRASADQMKAAIDQQLRELFVDNIAPLALRYSRDVTTILWGLVGSRLEGKYDRERIEELINGRIMDLEDVLADPRPGLDWLDQAKESEGADEGPRTFEPVTVPPEEISRIGRVLERKIERQILNQGIRDIVQAQAVHFIRKLEERYFFKTYYQVEPDRFVGQRAREAIQKTLQQEESAITRRVLEELLHDVGQALALQEMLHQRGLSQATTLNLYQLVAVLRAVKENKVLLADEMGLGKTLETLASFLASDAKELLVFAPNSVLGRWMDDIARHTDLQLEVVLLSDVEATQALKENNQVTVRRFSRSQQRYAYLASPRPPPGGRRILLMNYETVSYFEAYRVRHHPDSSLRVEFLALDEAHLLKNRSRKRSRAIFGNERGEGAIEAEHKMLLTGTPLENRPQDLFGMLQYLARGGTTDAERFFETIDLARFGRRFGKTRVGRLSELHGYLASRMIRRLKEDVLTGLPEKRYLSARLDPLRGTMRVGAGEAVALGGDYRRQLELYEMAIQDPEAFERRFVKGLPEPDIDDEERLADGEQWLKQGRQLIRLDQSLLDPGIFGQPGDSMKFDAAKRLIDERLSQDKSVLVFTNYRTAGRRLRTLLEAAYGADRIAYVDGNVKNARRAEALKRFQSKQAPIMVATVETMGLGVQLTQADAIIFLNYPWKPSTFNQAVDRAHRYDDEGRNYPGKQLEIIPLETELPISIDRLKAKVLKRKSILAEMIVEGNLSPEILSAFVQSDDAILKQLRRVRESPVALDEYELSVLQRFRLIIGQILRTTDPALRQELWQQAAQLYYQILEHKGSFFANMASLDFLSSSEFLDLKGRLLEVLDLGSGPSALHRAYERRRELFEERRDFHLRVTDYDLSPAMLNLGVHRPGGQVLGSFRDLGKVFEAGQFDLINLSFAYRYVEHPAQFIRDAHRLLKERGLLVMILPSTNIIPPRFTEALQQAGFDLRVGRTSRLRAKLDPESYRQLHLEFGREVADDIAREVQAEFTYLVANKARPMSGELRDEDLRLSRVIPPMNQDKVKRLTDSPGRTRMLPEESTVEGKVVRLRDLFSEPPAGTAERTQQKRVLRRLSGLMSDASQLAQQIQSLRGADARVEQRRADLDTELLKSVEALKDHIQRQVTALDEDHQRQLHGKLEELIGRRHVRQWFRHHPQALAELTALLPQPD